MHIIFHVFHIYSIILLFLLLLIRILFQNKYIVSLTVMHLHSIILVFFLLSSTNYFYATQFYNCFSDSDNQTHNPKNMHQKTMNTRNISYWVYRLYLDSCCLVFRIMSLIITITEAVVWFSSYSYCCVVCIFACIF